MDSQLQMEETPINGQIFSLNKHHRENHKKTQSVYKVVKQDIEKLDKLYFWLAYQEEKVGEQ